MVKSEGGQRGAFIPNDGTTMAVFHCVVNLFEIGAREWDKALLRRIFPNHLVRRIFGIIPLPEPKGDELIWIEEVHR